VPVEKLSEVMQQKISSNMISDKTPTVKQSSSSVDQFEKKSEEDENIDEILKQKLKLADEEVEEVKQVENKKEGEDKK